MDRLDKKARSGLVQFRSESSSDNIKRELDQKVDDLLGDRPISSKAADDRKEPKKVYAIPLVIISVILLSLIAYWGYSNAQKDKAKTEEPKVIFAQYFSPMDDVTSLTVRGEGDLKEDKTVGMQMYNMKKYAEAATILLAQDDAVSQVYGALSILNSGNADQASKLLNPMLDSPKYSEYHDILRWYNALAYLSMELMESAEVELQLISIKNGYKSAEARKILDEI